MKKSFITILSLLIILSTMGCGSPEPVSMPAEAEPAEAETAEVEPVEAIEKFTIAYIPPALISPYFIKLGDAMKEAAANYPNIEILVLAPSSESDINEQVRIIEDMTEKGVDLIALSTASREGVTPALEAAIKKGVQVVEIDQTEPISGLGELAVLGVDQVKGGEIAGEFAVSLLEGKGKIAILEGITGDSNSVLRPQGFQNITDQYPDIEIVTIQPAKWERAQGMSTAENIIQAFPDLNLIWGLNDNMALGALQAVQNANLTSQIYVMGYNGDDEAKQSVKEGGLVATVAQQPAEIGKTIVDIAIKLIEGNEDEIQQVYLIPVALVNQENVDDFIE